MGVDGLILSLGLGFLGFVLGLAKGSQSATNHCQEAFRREGYTYSEFFDILNDRK